MTRTLTISSGTAMPKIACKASACAGLSVRASSDLNGTRASPKSEMLAAPSRNAAQIWKGGPGRSSAAITSQSINSAGAMAAAPMTVGRDSSRNIGQGIYRYLLNDRRQRSAGGLLGLGLVRLDRCGPLLPGLKGLFQLPRPLQTLRIGLRQQPPPSGRERLKTCVAVGRGPFGPFRQRHGDADAPDPNYPVKTDPADRMPLEVDGIVVIDVGPPGLGVDRNLGGHASHQQKPASGRRGFHVYCRYRRFRQSLVRAPLSLGTPFAARFSTPATGRF